tara:strand:+ start:244 stop:402 length:159 start_codon:yes stop_codon:yes gene_type:complete
MTESEFTALLDQGIQKERAKKAKADPSKVSAWDACLADALGKMEIVFTKTKG